MYWRIGINVLVEATGKKKPEFYFTLADMTRALKSAAIHLLLLLRGCTAMNQANSHNTSLAIPSLPIISFNLFKASI